MFKALFNGWSLLSELSQQRSIGTAGAIVVNKPSPSTLDAKYMEHLISTLLAGVVVPVTSAKDGSAGYVLSEKTACDQRINILFSMISTMLHNRNDPFAANQDMLAVSKLYQDFTAPKEPQTQPQKDEAAAKKDNKDKEPLKEPQKDDAAAKKEKDAGKKEKVRWADMGEGGIQATAPTTENNKAAQERSKSSIIMARIESYYAVDHRLNEHYRRFTNEELRILQGHTSINDIPHRLELWAKIRDWYWPARTECRYGEACYKNECPYIHPHQPQPVFD